MVCVCCLPAVLDTNLLRYNNIWAHQPGSLRQESQYFFFYSSSSSFVLFRFCFVMNHLLEDMIQLNAANARMYNSSTYYLQLFACIVWWIARSNHRCTWHWSEVVVDKGWHRRKPSRLEKLVHFIFLRGAVGVCACFVELRTRKAQRFVPVHIH